MPSRSPRQHGSRHERLFFIGILTIGYGLLVHTTHIVQCSDNSNSNSNNNAEESWRVKATTSTKRSRTMKELDESKERANGTNPATVKEPRHPRKVEERKGELFNPWRDFVFQGIDNGTVYYSSHECVDAGHNERRIDATSRTCWYQNVYYNIQSKQFHYFPSPQERKLWGHYSQQHVFDQMASTISHVREGAFSNWTIQNFGAPYTPELHFNDDVDTLPPSNRTQRLTVQTTNNDPNSQQQQQQLHPIFMLYRPSENNFGHIIWDDTLSLFTQLDLHNLVPNDSDGDGDDDSAILPIPFFMDPHPKYLGEGCYPTCQYKYPKCTKMYRRIFPALWNVATDCSGDVFRTTNWLQGPSAVGRWAGHPRDPEPCPATDNAQDLMQTKRGNKRKSNSNNEDRYILIPNMTVGNGRSALFSCYGECTIGRGPQLFRFRNFLMRQILGTSKASALASSGPKGYITFSLPLGATRGKGEASLFEDEIRRVTEKYGDSITIRAVDLASVSMEEQAEIVGNSIILFTNHGGGSASTTFLPRGACAILYWRSFQRDDDFYRSVAYFRKRWVDHNERKQLGKIMDMVDLELEKAYQHYPHLRSEQLQR